MKIKSLILTLFLLPGLTRYACAQVQPGKNVEEAIEKSNRLYGEAFIKGDSTVFIDRYTPDAWIMNPGAPSLKGPSAAPVFYTIAYHQMNIRNVLLRSQEIVVFGEMASETGTYELRNELNKVLDKGKYLVLWKRTPKGWKMHRDCFNSDGPLVN